MRLAPAPESLAATQPSIFGNPDQCVTSQRIWVERKRLAETVIFERFIDHAFNHGRWLRQEFFPPSICVYLRKQDGTNHFLLIVRKFLGCCIGFVKKVGHSDSF